MVWPKHLGVPTCVEWVTHFRFFLGRFSVCFAGISSIRGACSLTDAAEPFQTITAIFPESTWSCLLLRIVVQDYPSEAMNFVYPPWKLRIFVQNITASWRSDTRVARYRGEGFEGGSEGKSQGGVASCTYLGVKFQECNKKGDGPRTASGLRECERSGRS